MCAEKVLFLIIIASVLMESLMAAPLSDDGSSVTRRPKNIRKSNKQRGHLNAAGKKSGDRWNDLSDKTVEAWKNSCESSGWIASNTTEDKYNSSYETIKVSIRNMNSSLALMDKINTTDIKNWEQFFNESFTFLPNRPTGIVHKWHKDTQIFVASFFIIHELQLRYDNVYNNHTVSSELKDILDQARALLCDIEHFVNATSNKDGLSKPHWYEKDEMKKIVRFETKDRPVNNMFVKARFQNYIEKLYKRIKHFNLERNLKTLKNPRVKTSTRPHRNRKNKQRGGVGSQKRRGRVTAANGEPTTTEKTIIITTKNARRKKASRLPGQKKQNKINQSLN